MTQSQNIGSGRERRRFRQLPDKDKQLETKQEFGKTLKAMRELAGLEVKVLSSIVGLTPDYIYKLERGDTSPPADERIFQLARAIGGSPDDLFSSVGRVAPDVREVFEAFPEETGAILRKIRPLGKLGRAYVLEKVEEAVREVFAENKRLGSNRSRFLIAG